MPGPRFFGGLGTPRPVLCVDMNLLCTLGVLFFTVASAAGCQERGGGPRATSATGRQAARAGPSGPSWESRMESGDVARIQSTHSRILIFDDGPYRCLAFGRRSAVQSCIHRTNRLDFRYEYVRLMFAVLALVKRPNRVLVLGLGGAALPSLIQKFFPNARIDAVEIDGGVVRAARKYLYYRPSPRTRIYVQDAARFVASRKGRERYDLIYVDCYDDKHIPKHLLADKFVRSVREILAPTGVVAANFWSGHPSFTRSQEQYRKQYPEAWILPGKRSGNHIVIGSTKPLGGSSQELLDGAKALEKRIRPPFLLSAELRRLKRL
jgi:spermidine synthase